MYAILTLFFVIGLLSLAPETGARETWSPKRVLAKIRKDNPHKRRCEDGVATSCFEYGLTLRRSPKAKVRKDGDRYVKRACLLAYAPACENRARITVKPLPMGKSEPVAKTHDPIPMLEQPPVEGYSQPVTDAKLAPAAAKPASTP